MDLGREITIVFQLKERKASGTWQAARDGEKRDIAIGGESRNIPWDESIWEKLFSNIQLNQDADRCRILVASDHPLAVRDLPELQSGWEWSLQELSQELSDELKSSTHKWILNGVSMGTGYRSMFPQTGGTSATHLYTVPPLPITASDKPREPLGKIYHETLVDPSERSPKPCEN